MNDLANDNYNDLLVEDRVRADRLKQLFSQSAPAIVGSYLAAAALCWLCWERFDKHVIFYWMALQTVAVILRATTFVRFFRATDWRKRTQRWEREYWYTLIYSAGIWGLGAFALMPVDDLLAQSIVILFAVGMSASAISRYSAYRNMTLSSIALVLLPSTTWILLQGSKLQIGIGLSVILFTTFLVNATYSLSSALERAFRLRHEMECAHRVALHASCTDELTGLNNRRAFFELANSLYQGCKARHSSVSMLMLDIDHFKKINDTYGHLFGDEVLKKVGEVLRNSMRKEDVYGRVGGEEFAILLPNTTRTDAHLIADRLRESILALSFNNELRVTVSVGMSCTTSEDPDLYTLINIADKALYQAKSLGRNQVAILE